MRDTALTSIEVGVIFYNIEFKMRINIENTRNEYYNLGKGRNTQSAYFRKRMEKRYSQRKG